MSIPLMLTSAGCSSATGHTHTLAEACFRRPIANARPCSSTLTYLRDVSPGGRISGGRRIGLSSSSTGEASAKGSCSGGGSAKGSSAADRVSVCVVHNRLGQRPISRPQLRSGILAAGRSLLSEETRSISRLSRRGPRAGAHR